MPLRLTTLTMTFSFLLRPTLPLWKFCLTAFPLALVPSLALQASAHLLLRAVGVDTSLIEAPSRSATAGEVLGAVAFAPVVETYLLAFVLLVLLKLGCGRPFAAIVSALLWGALHATLGPLWFFGTVWSFFVFSCAFLGWRERSFKQAFAAAAVPHALINLVVMVTVALVDGPKSL